MSHTITATFCDTAESRTGMQQISGAMGEFSGGFSVEFLETEAAAYYEEMGLRVEVHDLAEETGLGAEERRRVEPACLLIVRDALPALLGGADRYALALADMKGLNYDRKYRSRYGSSKRCARDPEETDEQHLQRVRADSVRNLVARTNLVVADFEQEPDYPNGKSRVVSSLHESCWCLRDLAEKMLGAQNSVVELNNYEHRERGGKGINYHGDGERRAVIGVRFGDAMPLSFRCYRHAEQVGATAVFELRGGDIYYMSAKAVGRDWMRSSLLTYRHAAGGAAFVHRRKKPRKAARRPVGKKSV